MKKSLLKIALLCSLVIPALQSTGQTILLTEDFTAGTMPAGWSQDSASILPFYQWAFNNPGLRTITGAAFDTSFVIFDSDHYATGNSEDCYLNLPSVNASVVSNLFLEMDEQYRAYTNGYHQIEVSTDGGVTWNHIITGDTAATNVGYTTAVHSTYDISSIAAGQSNVLIRFHYVGTYAWWWAIDNVQILSYPACASAPNAGTALATAATVPCIGTIDTLSLAGADVGALISYQWQSSPNNSTWTNIVGATSATFILSPTAPAYYRCNLTCSGLTSSSASVFVDLLSMSFCYCVPINPTSTTDCITNVEIVGTPFNVSSACASTGNNYLVIAPSPTSTADLMRSTNYNFNVTTSNDNIISVWIDFNENGTYEPSEWTQVATTSVSGVANTVTVSIPGSALVGPTGMRVRSRSTGSPNGPADACTEFFSGESLDFVIGIEFNVGINEMTQLNGVTFFPNPTPGKLSIFLSENLSGTTIQMYDVVGNLVTSSSMDGVLRTDMDISSLANGVYFARVQNVKGTFVQKIILNK